VGQALLDLLTIPFTSVGGMVIVGFIVIMLVRGFRGRGR